MKVVTIPVGQLLSNCHIVMADNGKAVLIDCGGSANRIIEYLKKNNLQLDAILLTHGHYDHFEGVATVKKYTKCRVYVSTMDSHMLTSPADSLAISLDYDSFNSINDYITVSDGDTIEEAGLQFTVISTSGHTDGSVCYLCQDALFSGDTLFRNSIGRTDFPTGDYFKMQASLRKIYNLSTNAHDYTIFTGHNQNTTLREECKSNPFLLNAIGDDTYYY